MDAYPRRRKAVTATTAALSAALPHHEREEEEEDAPAPPVRRARVPLRYVESEYDYFEAAQQTGADISLAAPAPRIDYPAREGVANHWEYAHARGLLASRRQPMCVSCMQRTEAGDGHSRCATAAGRGRGRRGGAKTPRGEYECEHPGCSHGCAINGRRDFAAGDGVPLDDGELAAAPPLAPPRALPPPYSVTACADEGNTYNGDITAAQAAAGVDVQGIPWESLPFTREDYRATRLRDTTNRDGVDGADARNALVKEPQRGARFYNFFQNTRRVKCSIVHFQLRNLAWATSKHDVVVMHEAGIVHWDAAAKRKTHVLDLSGSSTAVGDGLPMVQISTIIAKYDLVMAGGFYGEVVAKNLRTGKIVHNQRITHDENAITNAFDIFDKRLMTSSNDCHVRTFDLHTFQRISAYKLDTPVNHATRQLDGKMVCAVGDDKLVQVRDGESGERIAQLEGHTDFSFATWWHPEGRLFASGSQDKTCRVWDVRMMSRSLCVLAAHTSAVRAIRFSVCGRFMAMAEQKDYVHLFDVRSDFNSCQEIDLFGEIGGVTFTPCAETMYVAVFDRAYSSLMEFDLNRPKGLYADHPAW